MSATTIVLVAPIDPAPTGNGLAMRCELFRLGAARGGPVHTVVVPVAGGPRPRPGRTQVTLDAPRARAGMAALLADPSWRARLARATPLPPLARAASPGLAATVASGIPGGSAPLGVHVMRAYLAPFGLALAERLGTGWITLDLDDDDAALARASGDPETAAAYDRLLAAFAPCFDQCSAASPEEAEALAGRLDRAVRVIPNAVALPPRRAEAAAAGARAAAAPTLLFAGNLTYPPNQQAARALAQEILPRVQARLAQPARLILAGAAHPSLAGLTAPGVELTGALPSLEPLYAQADAVVAPLAHGAGTRIKLLEAFAHEVPVVASSAAARGLAVEHGRHLLIADGPEATAAAVLETLSGRPHATIRAAAARELVAARYERGQVAAEIAAMFACAGARQPAAAP